MITKDPMISHSVRSYSHYDSDNKNQKILYFD